MVGTTPKQRRAILEKIVGLEALEKTAARGGFADDGTSIYACANGFCVMGAILDDAGIVGMFSVTPTAYAAERALWRRADAVGIRLDNDEYERVSDVVTDLMRLNDDGRLRTERQVRRALGL